jgi:hypothetical protein
MVNHAQELGIAPVVFHRESHTKDAEAYKDKIMEYVLALYNSVGQSSTTGTAARIAFERKMRQLIVDELGKAWALGLSEFGLEPDEATEEEDEEFRIFVVRQQEFVQGLSLSIVGAKVTDLINRNSLGIDEIMRRVGMWALRWGEAKSLAALRAGQNQKAVWRRGPTEQGCGDCTTYDGMVFRLSVWRTYAPPPRSPRLECGGFNCLCELIPTNAPANPGRPPRVKGPKARKESSTCECGKCQHK